MSWMVVDIPPGFPRVVFCLAGFMGDFSDLGRGIYWSRVFPTLCFCDISFMAVRWVNMIGDQISETGSFQPLPVYVAVSGPVFRSRLGIFLVL